MAYALAGPPRRSTRCATSSRAPTASASSSRRRRRRRSSRRAASCTSDAGYVAPPANATASSVEVAPDSERLQLPRRRSRPGTARTSLRLPLLLKAKGKCTTDHISPAGPWLRFRGHLDKISDNMFTGAVNAFTGKPGDGHEPALRRDRRAASRRSPAHYKAEGLRWVVVGDENYGEGSSREHAAMSPRLLGGAAVIVRSFARIHESNLKKQGMLPLTFADPGRLRRRCARRDRISVIGLAGLAPGKPLRAILHHADGSEERDRARATRSRREQIGWFRAGSALNLLRQKP